MTELTITNEIQEDPILQIIRQASTDSNFDVDKLKTLIELHDNRQSKQAELAFNKDFALMQPKLPKVIAVHRNTHTKSNYAKLEDINGVVLPIISEYGFSMSFNVKNQDKESVTIQANLKHISGHQETTNLMMPYDGYGSSGKATKTAVHAAASTITYAKRYAMCMLLDISTGTDTDGNQVISPESAAEIKLILEKNEINVKKFLEYCKVNSVDEIPSRLYEKVMRQLGKKTSQIEGK